MVIASPKSRARFRRNECLKNAQGIFDAEPALRFHAGNLILLAERPGKLGAADNPLRSYEVEDSQLLDVPVIAADHVLKRKAYYGVQTMRALENFQLSGVAINHYPGFVEAWAYVKLAAAQANYDRESLRRSDCRQIP